MLCERVTTYEGVGPCLLSQVNARNYLEKLHNFLAPTLTDKGYVWSRHYCEISDRLFPVRMYRPNNDNIVLTTVVVSTQLWFNITWQNCVGDSYKGNLVPASALKTTIWELLWKSSSRSWHHIYGVKYHKSSGKLFEYVKTMSQLKKFWRVTSCCVIH